MVSTAIPGPAADPRLHWLWLGFDLPRLEVEYLQDRDREKAGLVFNTFGVGFVVYLLLMLGERGRILRHLPGPLVQLLIGVLLLNALAVLGARWIPALRAHLRSLVPPILGINSAVHVGAIALLPGYGAELPYSLLLIQLSFVLLLSGVLLRQAAPIGALFVLACGVVDYYGTQDNLYFEHMFLLLANLVLGSIVCYRLERSERLAWLSARRLRELAEHDELTGLYNRRYLDEHGARLLRQAQREHKPVTALFVDVDWFKTYNDSLGHLQGDDALQRVAATLGRGARRPLDFAARAGGEEFALLLYDCEPAAAMERAEQLRRNIVALQIHHPRSPLHLLTASIGVVTAPPAGDLRALLSAADRALYAAKHAGRNRVQLSPATAAP